jgi:hypothetical protein
MGLDSNGIRFLLHSRALGTDFTASAMIGRQGLHAASDEVQECFGAFEQPLDAESLKDICERHEGYVEGLLQQLGAKSVESFDYSSYECATHVHDMNQPIPERFKKRYSVVIDSGSLEHVFNYPVAIRNCLEMVAVGGHFITITPANNFFGHGFYQFSPELYYRVLSRTNGFEVMAAMLIEEFARNWYRVPDPEVLGRRVTLVNTRPALLAVVAQKLADVPIFSVVPQQSDYVAIWDKGRKDHVQRAALPKRAGSLARMVPPGLKEYIRRAVRSAFDVRGPEDASDTFELIDPPSAATGKRRA